MLSAVASDEKRKAEYFSAVEQLALLPAEQWVAGSVNSVSRVLCETRDAFGRVRTLLRKMGNQAGHHLHFDSIAQTQPRMFSGVDIEPAAQTLLLERTMKCRGVLMAGVPGGPSCCFCLAVP